MDNNAKLAIGAGVLGLVGVLAFAHPAQAAGGYTCPYGDGLTFKTLAELQYHVSQAHPGERLPISIEWK